MADPGAPGLEEALLGRLRVIAMSSAARGLADDAAVLGWPLGQDLVATHDMLAEGVHFTPDCPPADIGWKLVAVNLSDLAAMGARPVGVLMGAGLGKDRGIDWAAELVRGLGQALERFGIPLLGGDTIRSGPASVLSLTALGSAPPGSALGRKGATAGDDLWVSGSIGDAGLGLRVAQGMDFGEAGPWLLKRYRRPVPRLALGLGLRGIASAAMDVSDGLLIDAARMAQASGLAATIEAAHIPVSDAAKGLAIGAPERAAMGDDYELLFAAPTARAADVAEAAARCRTAVTRIGRLLPDGPAVRLMDADGADITPGRTGWVHG